MPDWQAQGPEFKPSYSKKKKGNSQRNPIVDFFWVSEVGELGGFRFLLKDSFSIACGNKSNAFSMNPVILSGDRKHIIAHYVKTCLEIQKQEDSKHFSSLIN